MVGLLLQARGGDLERGGGALMVGRHADMRVVVGLQVHGGDVTCITIVSVKNKKNWIGLNKVLSHMQT